MPVLGIFGIDTGGLNLVVNLMIVCLVAVWFATIYWTYADARRRMDDPMLITCAWAASVFPFVGALVYMIVRPPEYLEDIRERELEMQAAEARLQATGFQLCPHCDAEIERDFLRCPACMRRLREPCGSCGRPLEEGWKVCPYCEAEVGAAPQGRRSRRRAPDPGSKSAGSKPGAAKPASAKAAAAAKQPAGSQSAITEAPPTA